MCGWLMHVATSIRVITHGWIHSARDMIASAFGRFRGMKSVNIYWRGCAWSYSNSVVSLEIFSFFFGKLMSNFCCRYLWSAQSYRSRTERNAAGEIAVYWPFTRLVFPEKNFGLFLRFDLCTIPMNPYNRDNCVLCAELRKARVQW